MKTFEISSAEQMRNFGEQIGSKLIAGDVLVLSGPLGAGKTTFAQGVGLGLGIPDSITSPTFVIARHHRAGIRNLELVHVDAYRLANSDDLQDLEIDAAAPHVTLIEWGEHFVAKVADSWLVVQIDRSKHSKQFETDEGLRTVSLIGHGARWSEAELEELT